MTEAAEYVEARPGPGMPERWSYHWWQHERRSGLYQACRQWGLVVRWRRSETSGSLLYPPAHRADDEVKVELAEGKVRWVFVKYLPARTTRPKDHLHPLAYPYLGIEQLAISTAGEEAASVIRRCLARQFVEGRGRVVGPGDPKWLDELMFAFVRRGARRFR